MNVPNSEQSSSLDPACMEVIELSADDLDMVAGGETKYIVCDNHVVTAKPPPDTIPLPPLHFP